MLAGHYAAAFAAKAARPNTRWWMLLLAAQFVDVIWGVLVLAGIERAGLDYALPSNPLVAEYMPYTHSLLGAALWAGLAGVVVWWWRRSAGLAVLIAAVVVSHWFLDLAVHRPDLTLAGFEPKLGLRLWDHPVLAQVLELGLLGASFLALRRSTPGARARRVARMLLVVLVVVQVYAILAPPPATVTEMAGSLLVLWLGLAAWAGWMESRG
jgi:hypothetical protein